MSPALAAHPAVEAALRAAADRVSDANLRCLARVDAIERDGRGLRVIAEAPAGMRLSEWLDDLEAGRQQMDDGLAIEAAVTIVQAVAAVHRADPLLTHGAITPAHIVFTADRGCVLTDCIFARALESLQRNRESLWREFGVALPPSASAHRFDQRGDVTQVGAIVLALLMRRALRKDEYPRGVADLVTLATPDSGPHASAIRMWLQQALQLHPRAVFASAEDAGQAFTGLAGLSGLRRTRRASAFAMIARPATMAAARCGIAP